MRHSLIFPLYAACYAVFCFCLTPTAASQDRQPKVGPSGVTVIASFFVRENSPGDFRWMRQRPEYDRALFIFNDNEEDFLSYLNNPNDKNGRGCAAGGGNARIRPWQCELPPRSAGIPTGTLRDGGYRKLDAHVKLAIDRAIEVIDSRVKQHNFDKVFFSSCRRGSSAFCTLDDDLGTSIFSPAEEVRKYIVQKLRALQMS
jgi:hypothetical protein